MTATFQLNAFQGSQIDEKSGSHESLNQLIDRSLSEIDWIVYRYICFNFLFFSGAAIELSLFIAFFTLLLQSFLFAFGLALIFFTAFAYFTLRIYFQTKKTTRLISLKDEFVEECKTMLQYEVNPLEKYAALANACCKFANRLHAREYQYYRFPKWSFIQMGWLERLSCQLHWREMHLVKELLLQEAVQEHIKLVKSQPTSLEAHASLANAYVMLSGIYIDPRKLDGYDEDRWIPPDKYNEDFDNSFRLIAARAIEEFKIIEEYSPDDPWVHSQLAYSYHDLQMPLEEIREYEMIQKLIPDDKDNLWTLGQLYFQQGMNAKGLKVYEELINANYERAESLITYYGSFQ